MYIKITKDAKVFNKWIGVFSKPITLLEGDFASHYEFIKYSYDNIKFNQRNSDHDKTLTLVIDTCVYKDIAYWEVRNIIMKCFDSNESWWKFW